MKTIPFVHEGLGNSSFVVDLGNGSALIVDPDRSVQKYLNALEAADLKAAGILETHLHADFVSGARDLAAQTSAPIFLSAESESKLPHQPLRGGQVVALAGCELSVLASPGHTPEHLSFVLRNPPGPPVLFSGGSLIVGGAARTDLISEEMTESLTRAQFRTLQEAFARLPDETLLFPTHGGGSFCSTGAGTDRASTLGRERRENPLLALSDEAEFVDWFPTTFPAVPDYFYRLRAVNQVGPRLRRDIADPPALDSDQFQARAGNALLLDIRSKEEYARGHIRGSLHIPFRDSYAVWLGWLVSAETPLLFVTGDVRIEDVVRESLLVGHERFVGWLKNGMDAWEPKGQKLVTTELVGASEAKRNLLDGAASLDVREADEYHAGHIDGAIYAPLGRLSREMEGIPRDRPVVVYCAHGDRASTAASILEASGFDNLINLDGGTTAWEGAGYSLVR